jgi:hypothetical protein
MPRTEEEKTIQAPIVVTLGSEEHKIKPLPILKSREWREQVAKRLGPSAGSLRPVDVHGRMFIAGLPSALAAFPETICDLLFAYAPDLEKEKDKILETATEEQITAAFSRIWEVAFANFLPLLMMTREMLTEAPTPPASPKSLN